ncbi:MAG: hypothetical protein CL811_09590 [Colwelliaceae bacterium]|nr:hypothetical protein [Colwelliaceae bacterium]
MSSVITPFFRRLYGSLFLAILSSVILTFLVLEKWNEYDAVEDFVSDTLFVKNLLESQRKSEAAETFYSNLNSELYPFDIQWLLPEVNTPCNDCMYLSRYKSVEVYELEEGELLSIHNIEGATGQLIISDKVESADFSSSHLSLEHSGIEHFDIEEYSIFILLFVISAVIGLVLYLPIRKLQKEINHLSQISYQFGNGALDSRVEPLSEPLTLLANTFNKMAQSLSSKVNESQVFAQAVPHELRTPLSRIQLATGILRNKLNDAEQIALIENIDQYIADIDELCSQVIQLSKLNIQSKEDEDEILGLNHFIQYRVSQLPLTEQIYVDANFDDDVSINCNAAHLRLVIDNLLKNAVQHAKHKVIISVGCLEQSVQITIEDDGLGIPENEYENIFIPYARLDSSRTRKTGGLGLGLAIVKSAVSQLNGDITVSSADSGGAMFKITLPLR